MATKPAIILADEQTGSLDSRTSQDVLGLMKTTGQRFGQTIVMITHNDEIAQMTGRIIRLEDGKIEVQFDKDESSLMKEYFPDCPIEKIDDKVRRIFIDVPAKERLWKALLLSFGSRVKVIGPDDYKEELIATAQNFLSNYDI